MTKDEAIKYLQQLYPNGGCSWLDEKRIEAISMAVDALKEEPVSEDLEQEIAYLSKRYPEVSFAKLSRIAVHIAKWQKEQMMKDTVERVKKKMITRAIAWVKWNNRNGSCLFDGWKESLIKAMEEL